MTEKQERDTELEAFEAWAVTQVIPQTDLAMYSLVRRPDGHYRYPATHHAWLGYQAARSQQQPSGSFMTREQAIEFCRKRRPGIEPTEQHIAATIDAYAALFGDTVPADFQQRGWQPISEAPKDGTRILLYREGWAEAACIGFWSADFDEWHIAASGCSFVEATHWKPLDAPPALSDLTGGGNG